MPDQTGGHPYVFVSYASVDRDRVLPIIDRLEAVGVKTWIDRDGIHGGANYALEIAEAIEHASAMLIMCSPASLASRNVKQEIALGWRFDRPYLPLLLEMVEIPKDVAYWLEASQWIEVLDHSTETWLANVADALKRHGFEVAFPSESTQSLAVRRARPLLVGREREQTQLREQLERMLAGQGGTILVGGEAGIGKSTLVEDLSAEAEERGCLVLWGHAYDLSVTPPYGPWLEIFRQFRSVAESLPPLPAFIGNAEELAKAGSQESIFAAVTEFFRSVATQRPLMLVLDDLHWADQASLDFVRYLARQLHDHALLFVATYREDELTRRHPLALLLPRMTREAQAVRMNLRSLDDPAIEALVARRYRLPAPDERRLVGHLAQRSDGNPFFVRALLDSLEHDGVVAAEGDHWRLAALPAAHLPPLVQEVVEARLAVLPDDVRAVLEGAAVLGHEVPLEPWQRVTGLATEQLIAVVEQAATANVLERR